MLSIANILSIIRALLVIPVIYFLNRGYFIDYLIAFFLIVAAVLTDYFDGYFARRFKQISITGKVLDPLADKIFIGVIAIFLVIKKNFPVWYVSLIIGRDLIICIFNSIFIRKRGRVIQSNIIGKITINILVSSAGVYIIDWDFMKLPLVYLGTFFIILSLISYGRLFLRLQKDTVKPKV